MVFEWKVNILPVSSEPLDRFYTNITLTRLLECIFVMTTSCPASQRVGATSGKMFSQPRQCVFMYLVGIVPERKKKKNEEHGVATNYRQSFPSKFQRTTSNVSTARWASTLLKYLYLEQHSSSTILHPNYIYHLPTPVYVEAIWIMVLTNHLILHSYDLVEAGSTFLLSPLALSPFTHVLDAARSDNRNRPPPNPLSD